MEFSSNQMLDISPNLQIAIYLKDKLSLLYFFSVMLKRMRFPLTVLNRTSNLGKDFALRSLEFYSSIQFEIRKKIGLLILLNCEAASLTVFTTMGPKEQQTSDNSYTDDIIILLNIIFTGLYGYEITPGLSTNKQRHRLLLPKTGIHVAPTHL